MPETQKTNQNNQDFYSQKELQEILASFSDLEDTNPVSLSAEDMQKVLEAWNQVDKAKLYRN